METEKVVLLVMIFSTTFLISCNKDDCIEKKKEECIVTFELNRVCGCNGVTYENPSTAECSNISDYTMGACK